MLLAFEIDSNRATVIVPVLLLDLLSDENSSTNLRSLSLPFKLFQAF